MRPASCRRSTLFGCVFGQNGQYGVAMVNGCYDAAFHGCYFLLNGKYGLVALNGCTLLSNCGFENNHEAAPDFAEGGAGIWLQGFGTLIGCTAYSMFKQKRLIDAYVGRTVRHDRLLRQRRCGAKGAGLARLDGEKKARATVIAPSGSVEYVKDFDALEISAHDGGGVRFGAQLAKPQSRPARRLPALGRRQGPATAQEGRADVGRGRQHGGQPERISRRVSGHASSASTTASSAAAPAAARASTDTSRDTCWRTSQTVPAATECRGRPPVQWRARPPACPPAATRRQPEGERRAQRQPDDGERRGDAHATPWQADDDRERGTATSRSVSRAAFRRCGPASGRAGPSPAAPAGRSPTG